MGFASCGCVVTLWSLGKIYLPKKSLEARLCLQPIIIWRDFQPEEPRVSFVVSSFEPIQRLLFVTHSDVGMCIDNREDVMMAGAFLELIENLACLPYVSREAIDLRTNCYAKVSCCTTRFAFFHNGERFGKHLLMCVTHRQRHRPSSLVQTFELGNSEIIVAARKGDHRQLVSIGV